MTCQLSEMHPTNGNHLLDLVHAYTMDYHREAEKRRLVKLLPPAQPGRFVKFISRWHRVAQMEEKPHGRANRKLLAVR